MSDNDNPVDPVTGLSRKEKDYVQQSWNLVRPDLKSAGNGFFHAYGIWSLQLEQQACDSALFLSLLDANETFLWHKYFVHCLIRFFTAHPDYQQKFKAFRDIPIEELPNNKGFQVYFAYFLIKEAKLKNSHLRSTQWA